MKSIYWIVAILVVIVGFFFLMKAGVTEIDPPFEAGVLHPLDHTKGNASSTLVVMEYSDFECPACRSYYPIVREIVAEFGDRIIFVYRNFPLITIHPNAEFAARAAEAASKQGKFWEMHDLLFEKQSEWSKVSDVEPIFIKYADLIGISTTQFKTDWSSKEVKDFVRAQRIHSLKSGLEGTPTFFVGGKKIQNPASAEEFKNIIRNALLSP